jgi:FkbH-like protein
MIKANWEPKSENLQAITQELALLPESFVFVDDNPAERAIINQVLPSVSTPEITEPEHYIRAIDSESYFEVTSLTKDDIARVDRYNDNAKRSKLQTQFTDYSKYLHSLEMTAEIKPFAPMYMSRIAQLTNKSNQFNLTTLRCTQEEIERYATDPRYITLYGKLIDKFGDNGVVSIALGEIDGAALHIRLWLMSCRVLKRDMEFAMMDELVRLAKEAGVIKLRGYYFPTAKNAMMRDFYDKMRFALVTEDENGNKIYALDLSEYESKQSAIKVNGGNQ